jgi:hypothetical protein
MAILEDRGEHTEQRGEGREERGRTQREQDAHMHMHADIASGHARTQAGARQEQKCRRYYTYMQGKEQGVSAGG